MRVLLVGPAMHGGEGVYMDLLRDFPPSDVEYVSAGGVHTGAPGAPCDVVWEIAFNRLVRPRTIPDSSFRALRLKAPFDLVHVHAHPVHMAKLRDTPLVMSEGSSSAVYLGDYLGWSEDRLAGAFRRASRIYRLLGVNDRLLAMDRAARVYVFSEWARDLNVRWGADPGKIDVVAPGFPIPPPIDRGVRESFSFLFVGTDFERKGGFDLVEAFDLVSHAHPDARLILAGSDPWEPNPDRLLHGWVSDARRARVLEVLERLMTAGLVRNDGIVASSHVREVLYPEADAFVMPTLAEGFGFTNVEAMSYGLPVISSSVGPIPEIVIDEKTGLVVPPGDVAALTEAMQRLVSERDLARKMGDSGYRGFRDRYTTERFRADLGDVYRRALAA